MNIFVIVLLSTALCVQVVALGLMRSPQVTESRPGVYELEFFERRRFWANILTVVGLIMATAASLLSVLSSGN